MVLTKISGRHMDVTDAIRDFVEKKIARLSKFYNRISEIEVVLNTEGLVKKVEIIVNVDHAKPLVVHEAGEDMYASLDAAIDKCERQLTRHKEKSRDRKHRSSAAEITEDILESRDADNEE